MPFSRRPRVKWLAGGFSVVLILAAAVPAPGKPSKEGEARAAAEAAKAAGKVQWLSFDAAVSKAKKENKHVIVDVYTNWCGWCKVMDKQTYGDPMVASYLNENFALAKVNGESSAWMTWKGDSLSERQFAKAIGVNGYPATYFMKPNEEMLGGVAGYIKTPEMMIYAKFVNTRYYEKGQLKQFADSLRKLGS
jgi:thioredoxin-related protein